MTKALVRFYEFASLLQLSVVERLHELIVEFGDHDFDDDVLPAWRAARLQYGGIALGMRTHGG